MYEPSAALDLLAAEVYQAARDVRNRLGAGLYESAYERLLAHRLRKAGHRVDCQVPIRLVEDGADLGLVGRIDMVVDDALVLELKAVAQLHPIHTGQLLTYLRIGEFHLGFLINFHAVPFHTGVIRRVNGEAAPRPGDVASLASSAPRSE